MKFEITDLLQCPKCGGKINDKLACVLCSERYSIEEGIYNFVIRNELKGAENFSDKLAKKIQEIGLKKLQKEYQKYINEDSRRAKEIAGMNLQKHLKGVKGVTIDLATGLSGVFPVLLHIPNVIPIATDISLDILKILKERIGSIEKDHYFIACDAKNMPFMDSVIDNIISVGGLSNIPEPCKALSECYRVLYDNGEIISVQIFVEEGSESAERAREFKVYKSWVKSEFEQEIKNVGFRECKIDVVSSAIVSENPYDELTVAGDKQYYAIIRATK
ncbi:MAG TPA: methyltransferase domain-containing protein [Thermoplasmatales archaeon]|nr:methyltransferase domain-containing protein [Thermoplasmatales archaeon]HEX08471.1 methyltransferase domain-containing protein [Thermoplasmatales archaeon]